MNARTLGISLAVGYLILPFAAIAGAFLVLDDELGGTATAVSTVLSMPFIIGTTAFVVIATRRCIALPRRKLLPRLLLFLPILILIGWSIVLNAAPRRITPDTVSSSPFDKYWYSAPQTAYGTPIPFLRYFDDTVPDGGYPEIRDSLFDISALLGNLTIWSFPLFVMVSLVYILLPTGRDDRVG